MKIVLHISLIFTSITFAQYIPSYVESSNGLNDPFLESGRTELEIADVNGDGHLDIISVGDHGSPYINTVEHGVMVWFGDGAGNWSVFQYGNFGYGGVAIGDVNNDGNLDVGYGIHHNYSGEDLGDQILEVALGDGTGRFWTAWDNGLANNGETWGMFCTDFADIDNDGDLDIGANSFGSGAGVHFYLNQGDGSWIQSFGFLDGNSTMDFVFGDVNNDGFPDAAVAHQYGTVYINDGTGNFIMSDGNLPASTTLGRRGPDLGDIDNDGMDELSFANSDGGVEVWKWSEENFWTSISNNLPSTEVYDVTQLYDMNMDGNVDVIAFGEAVVTIWLGDGAANWNQASQINLVSTADFEAFRIEGDADHNGYPDIALVSEEGSWPSDRNHLRFFKEDSPADSLSISSIYPGPYRRWKINSVQTIKWISEIHSGDSSWVKLEVSINDTLGPWQLINSNIPNNGHHQIVVPGWMASEQICRLRYTVYSQSDSASSITPQGFYIIGEPVDAENDEAQLPQTISLFQNYPNPFNPATIIKYQIPELSFVILKVYDVLGSEVATLANEEKPTGEYNVEFDATGLTSGIYFYELKVGSFVETKKMVLIK
jgi:hypothetical protein